MDEDDQPLRILDEIPQGREEIPFIVGSMLDVVETSQGDPGARRRFEDF